MTPPTDDLKPAQCARRRIDEQLSSAGWKVVKYQDVDFLSDDDRDEDAVEALLEHE